MKRLTLVTATVAALAIASTPAFADNNGKALGLKKQVAIEVNGTVATVVDTATITVMVKAASQPKALKALTKSLKDTTITVKSDTKTVVKRGGASVALGNLVAGDKVNLRAVCTKPSTVVCIATRVTATPAKPAPSPSAASNSFKLELRGTVSSYAAGSNGAGVLGVLVVSADAGKDSTIKEKAIQGTTFSLLTDSATVVTRAGSPFSIASLVTSPVTAVNIEATCTPASPAAVCTAKRITVIVPTA